LLIEQKASTLQLVVKGLIRLPPVKHVFILQLINATKNGSPRSRLFPEAQGLQQNGFPSFFSSKSPHFGISDDVHSRPLFILFDIFFLKKQYENPAIDGKTFYYWTYDLFLDSPKRSKNLAISIFSFIINKSKSF